MNIAILFFLYRVTYMYFWPLHFRRISFPTEFHGSTSLLNVMSLSTQ